MSATGMSISILENHIRPQWSRFDHLVSPVGLAPKRWLETCFLAVEKNRALLDHDVREHLRWINTSATLGLEPDGALGQMFAIPFGGKNPCIQPITGYKGMNTTAGRAGIVIHGDVLREGDDFTAEGGAGQPFRVRLRFGDRQSAPIIGAWAQGELPNGRFTTPVIMDLSELLAVKAKSPGARKSDSPWNDAGGPGFAAMCSKTAKRRLQRHLPALLTKGLESLNISQHALAATVDTLHEDAGHRTFIDDKAQVIDAGTIAPEAEAQPGRPWPYRIEQATGEARRLADAEEWRSTVIKGLAAAPNPAAIRKFLDRNRAVIDGIRELGHEAEAIDVLTTAQARIDSMGGGNA